MFGFSAISKMIKVFHTPIRLGHFPKNIKKIYIYIVCGTLDSSSVDRSVTIRILSPE